MSNPLSGKKRAEPNTGLSQSARPFKRIRFKKVSFSAEPNGVREYPLDLGSVISQYTNTMMQTKSPYDSLKVHLLERKQGGGVNIYEYSVGDDGGLVGDPALPPDTKMELIEFCGRVADLKAFLITSARLKTEFENRSGDVLLLEREITKEQHQAMLEEIVRTQTDMIFNEHVCKDLGSMIFNDYPDCARMLHIFSGVSRVKNFAHPSADPNEFIELSNFNMLYCLPPAAVAGGNSKRYVRYNSKRYLVRKEGRGRKSFILSKGEPIYLKDIKGKFKYQ